MQSFFRHTVLFFMVLLFCAKGLANPYPDPAAVPQDIFIDSGLVDFPLLDAADLRTNAIEMLRFRFDWDENSDTFSLANLVTELSGTAATVARSTRVDRLGSYRLRIISRLTGKTVASDSIGTGQEFRKLSRALHFRAPLQAVKEGSFDYTLEAENPETGILEVVLHDELILTDLSRAKPVQVEVRLLREATVQPEFVINIYAEGYKSNRKQNFWNDASKVFATFQRYGMPSLENLTMRAVFGASNKAIGSARNLGMPVPERDSFLGLYFPYWNDFGRWYHVVYPTRVEKYRAAVGSVPYDYPITLIDSSDYFGVGNYKELTAVPAKSSSFSYLLMHEFGHFLGLNEEYEGGGKTELAFAPGIEEPWSQNITFRPSGHKLKWGAHVSASTPIPTPDRIWRGSGPYGAYRGGYAQTEPFGMSHKPGQSCTMESAGDFCAICMAAMDAVMAFDRGE